jgi:DNA-damage-inducible protein J
MDETLKRDFEVICDEVGLTMTTAFIIFAKTVTDSGEMPFKMPTQSVPGAKTPRPGSMKGQIWMSDDFDEPLDDFKEYTI